VPAVGFGRLAIYRVASCLDLAAGGSKEDHAQDPNQECPRGSYPNTKEELMKVIIGIDPHKSSHTAVAIGCDERQLGEIRVRATCQQTEKLLAWAEPLGDRTWAVESAGGLGYLLSQQLVRAGERVLDVPATLASRVRVLGTGRSDKSDPNDALSVAVGALRSPGLRSVEPANHGEVLRLLAKRNHEIGRLRNSVVSRLHAALANCHRAEWPRNSTLLTPTGSFVISIRLPRWN
jgi:transposase